MGWRYFFTIGILLAGGLLGAASIIVKAKPNAKDLIDKLAPHQGYIGAVLFIWGVWDAIAILPHIGWWFKFSVLRAVFVLVAVFTELFLGFLLGFGMITKYALSKNQTAMEKGQAIRGKLAPFQGILGFTAIGVAVGLLVLRFI